MSNPPALTQDEFEQIQSICRQWMREPTTHVESRLTIPSGVVSSRTIVIHIEGLLTFDNVLVESAVDTDTGVSYLKRIGEPGTEGSFIDAPFELIESAEQTPERPVISEHFQEPARETAAIKHASEIESDPDEPRVLLYSKQILLGYSRLERNRGNNQRKGRLHPSDDYFDYSEMFAAFPQAENDCMEANVGEAYGLTDEDADDYRRRFNELQQRIEAMKLYIADESGKPIETAEVRVEDLSRHYDDPSERWLHVEFKSEG